jgi:hypothetical protein
VLATGKHTEQTWTPRDSRLLASIANQVALAIDNARLYGQVHERERHLNSGNEVLRNINDMLLEKNAYLEGFVNDDLPQALTEISQIIQYLLVGNPTPLADQQKDKIAHLQTIVNRLGELSTETTTISTVLDTELDKSLDEEVKQNTFTGAVKPVRLHGKKSNEDSPEPEQNQAVDDGGEIKPMSFEEAVAAGLVPAHIMSREA